jgi:hypothetical protein
MSALPIHSLFDRDDNARPQVGQYTRDLAVEEFPTLETAVPGGRLDR